MKKIIRKLFAPIALLSLALGVGLAASREVVKVNAAASVTLTTTKFGLSGTSYATKSFTEAGVTFNITDCNVNNGLNMKARSGEIYNSSGFSGQKITSIDLSNIKFSSTSGAGFSVYGGTSAKATTTELYRNTGTTTTTTTNVSFLGYEYNYFYIKNTGTRTAAFATGVVINYDVVGGPAVPVSGISIDDNIESLSLIEGTSQQLTATIAPSDATNKNVSWSSSDETKVTVVNGLVNALAVTSTPVTVTVTTADGGKTDSVEVTVTADPFTVVKTSTFGGSGNSDYPTVTGMGTYFSTGYGTADKAKVAKVKSTNSLLANVPVASDIKVKVAAVVNHATDTKTATVYGLDYAGDRISEMSGTYTVPAAGGATGSLPNMTTFAEENQGLVILNRSLTNKAYGIEVEFGTSAARALLVQISVYYSFDETDENQAIAFANLVNNDVGLGANGSCSSILGVLQNDYSLLSSGAKTIVDTSSDNDFVSARERLSYLESWVAQNSSANLTREAVNNSSNRNLVAVVSMGLIGLTSILGYYFINKKRSLG